jgi:hypothetical protein
MYLHSGNGKSVKKKRIIGIFDMDSSTESPITRDFLQTAEKRKRTEYGDDDIPRSFVLTQNGPYDRVILSKISTHGLKSRCEGNSLGDEI